MASNMTSVAAGLSRHLHKTEASFVSPTFYHSPRLLVCAREKINAWILAGDHTRLLEYRKHGSVFDFAISTPALTAFALLLGRPKEGEQIVLFNDELLANSLSMTSLKIGESYPKAALPFHLTIAAQKPLS